MRYFAVVMLFDICGVCIDAVTRFAIESALLGLKTVDWFSRVMV
jgi:hypothetical protein